MTTEIARFIQRLERIWDEHTEAVLDRRDLAAALRDAASEPSVRHLPAGTGAAGRAALEHFYTADFFPHLPADLVRSRISRTVDRFRLVDETAVTFTHDRELPWLLPGAPPTGRRADVVAVTVAQFRRGQLQAVRVRWDHATLTAQLGLPALVPAPPG